MKYNFCRHQNDEILFFQFSIMMFKITRIMISFFSHQSYFTHILIYFSSFKQKKSSFIYVFGTFFKTIFEWYYAVSIPSEWNHNFFEDTTLVNLLVNKPSLYFLLPTFFKYLTDFLYKMIDYFELVICWF